MPVKFASFKGPRCFVQVGSYEGRNKRVRSVFRVVQDVDLNELKAAVEAAVNSVPTISSRKK